MSEARFTVKFEGPAVENGEIDVQDLAPALLAVGGLMQAANDVINKDRVKASVRVRATATSCFEVDLTLIQEVLDSAQQIIEFAKANKEGIEAANELADLVLKVGGAAGAVLGGTGGLLALLKHLRGRKPDKVEKRGGDVILHLGDTHFTTNQKTILLAEDVAVREQARKLVSVLKQDGIESFSARQPTGDELRIERDDVPSFEVPEGDEEELIDDTRLMNLQIISLSFKEEHKWRFTEGAEPFTATIEDIDFLNRIGKGEVRFGKNDYIVCKVRERQVRTLKGLRIDRSIVHVVDYKPSPRQLRLI